MAPVKPLASPIGATLIGMAPDNDDRALVADRLRLLAAQLGRELGNNDTAVSQRMGIGQTVLSKIKTGARSGSLKTVLMVVREMKINPMFFFDDTAPEPDYRDYMLATTGPAPGDGAPSISAATDPRVRASLEAFARTHDLSPETRVAAERVAFGYVPDATDWAMWLMQWDRAKREGRTDLSERDIARTASRSRKPAPPR